MVQEGRRPIQAAVKDVCSISYVSEKLQVSRPSLYKYMELYDSGDVSKIPDRVTRFFDFLMSGQRSEDDAILYFINESRNPGQVEAQTYAAVDPDAGIECIVGGGRAMVTFPGVQDPSDVIVEVMVRTDRGYAVIGEYRPEPGMRFVTIDNLVPEHTFFYSVRTASGGMSATEPAAFTLDKKV